MMRTSDLFLLSLHNLLLHKVRSLLTSLGVIFGVGSVIAMLAISEGAKRSALEQIQAMGTDKIILYSRRPPSEGRSEGSSDASVVDNYGLTAYDRQNLLRMDNVAEIISVFDTREKILSGLNRTDLKLVGCDLDFLKNSAAHMESGRWFSAADFRNSATVCVIGRSVKRKLYRLGDTGIVGSLLHIGDAVYRVVGVLSNDYGSKYPEIGGQNEMIFIPMPTAKVRHHDYMLERVGVSHRIIRVEYDLFLIRVNDTQFVDNTAKRITAYLDKTHSSVRDWGISVPFELLRQQERTSNIFTIVMGSIAGISLVVGGIGIMNIMLASVYERRKEIGTRRALGAQKADILLQFLIETVALTTLGGALGVALGIGIGSTITAYSGMPTIYSVWSIVLSMAISTLVGVIFGTYPAYQAAQQNPITVLRAE